MIDIQQTKQQLQDHVHALTVTVGERSVRVPENLEQTAAYITSFYEDMGIAAASQEYSYAELQLGNIVAEIAFRKDPKHRFLIGAHYDSVSGTVGADDNASGVAVMLELVRVLGHNFRPDYLKLAELAGVLRGIWAAGCMQRWRAPKKKKSTA